MRPLIRLIRIYTPFICTVMVLLNGVLFMKDENGDSDDRLISNRIWRFYYRSHSVCSFQQVSGWLSWNISSSLQRVDKIHLRPFVLTVDIVLFSVATFL